MKTLYLSDLDGTLLRSNERISIRTAKTVNRFVRQGGLFSYATARSLYTAGKVTAGMNAEFPVICYNGAFILGNATKDVLRENYFRDDEATHIRQVLAAHGVSPIVYAYINGKEHFSFIKRDANQAMHFFLDSRLDDPRRRAVQTEDELFRGSCFYVSCMGEEAALAPLNAIFAQDAHVNCIYDKEIYSGAQWCELLPVNATKANAALQLKAMLGCDRLVAFGDGRNDISLFSVADASYAMANAAPELKEMATAVIGSNDEDGVAEWLERNVL
ncbi:MAG: HAD family hydrolase [Oscillospiraceae bacterium]|jgi:Cof subfamily protein (haloacid dehalogenase superfamily)|nr:HAD family hydrolase [Oscillospiraceae bacterium]